MKKGIHPENYRPVIFKDMSNGDMFLSRSTAKSNETEMFEGQEYPVIKIEISSTSHPFYTGKAKLVDTAGRVDKFMNRYAAMKKKEKETLQDIKGSFTRNFLFLFSISVYLQQTPPPCPVFPSSHNKKTRQTLFK